MQQPIEDGRGRTADARGRAAAERERLELVVSTMASLGRPEENLAEVAHDARNMVTALGLYCELLQEPGVLSESFRHYASELQLVTAASRRLVDKLSTLDARQPGASRREESHDPAWGGGEAMLGMAAAHRIENLREHLLGQKNLLAALVGPGIQLRVHAEGGDKPVDLSGEDLTRILVNLVKNAAEAIPGGGQIHIELRESCAPSGQPLRLLLTVEDNGPGLPERVLEALERIESGAEDLAAGRMTPLGRRGLGLSITRSVVEAAGGRLHAANRDPAGACLQVELPVRQARPNQEACPRA